MERRSGPHQHGDSHRDPVRDPTGPATPTPTATLTPNPSSTIGGRGLTLQTDARTSATLTWTDGGLEIGYLVLRWGPTEGFAFFPPDLQPLPADRTTFTDQHAFADLAYCYLVLPLKADPRTTADFLLGFSDFFCFETGTGATPPVPADLRVQLNQSPLARLSWTAVPGATDYELRLQRFDGTLEEVMSLPASPTTLALDTGGKSTCYQLTARAGSTVLGSSASTCVVPGSSTLG